jgi:hypothetical protein
MDYAQLSYLFVNNDIPIRDNDVLVDVGCGKGRVINFWLGRGHRNRIVGVELDETIASVTRARLARFLNVEIISGDAAESVPADGTLFFLFNPFDQKVMKRFAEQLKRSPHARIIYWYCMHVDIFKNDPWWIVADLRTGDHKPGVLIRPKAAVTAERDGSGAGVVARGTASQGQNEQLVTAQSRG